MENQTFSPKNYTKGNTPEWAQKAGDAALAVGVAGGLILALPITLPAAVVTAAGYALAVGAIGKAFCKFFGIKSEE